MSRARVACLAALSVLAASASLAHADGKRAAVVNVIGPEGAPVAARLRRLLEEQRKLALQSGEVTAVLEGQPAPPSDFGPVRTALSDFRYQDAERLLGDLTDGLLQRASADVTLPLAEVLGWRGLLAAVDDREKPPEQRRKAKQYFAAAFTLDPEFAIDVAMTSPRLRLLMDEARRRPEMGKLLLTVTFARAGKRKRAVADEPAAAAPPGGEAEAAATRGEPAPELSPELSPGLSPELSIDGKPSAPFGPSVDVPVGLHLLRVTAPARAPVLRLVEVTKAAPVRLQVELAPESTRDKVHRLIGETASVPEGRPRLSPAQKLGAAVGTPQLLLLESFESQRAKIRLYDVSGKRFSQQFSFAQSDSTAAVSAAVERAFAMSGGDGVEPRWYQRWQVWAGVGAVVAGGIATALIINAVQEPRVQGL